MSSYCNSIYKVFSLCTKLVLLTIDVDLDAFADGWRHFVGGDAEEGPHVLPSNLDQIHRLSFPGGHFLLVNATPDNEP